MVGKKKPSSRSGTQNPSRHRKPMPRGFAKEANKKIADDLLAAKADIRNGMFDYSALAEKHGVTFQVVLGVLQRLRRQKKIPRADPFVRPIGEKWKNAAPLRESKRKKFITEHITWDVQDLADRLGFKSIKALQGFVRNQNLPIKLKPRSVQKKQPAEVDTALAEYREEREGVLADMTSPPDKRLTIKAEHTDVQEGACVAMVSRLELGGTGYRRGLVRLAGEVIQAKGTHFILIAGGLVDKRALRLRWNAHIKEHFFNHAIPQEERALEREKEFAQFCQNRAMELADDIPHVKKPDGTLAKYYIITSEAYDGDFGKEIGWRLAEIRDQDIVYWCHGTNVDRPITVKHVDKTILPIVPLKPSWRSRYYSTAAQREIQDVEKRSAKRMADFYAVGCFGGSVERPSGESKRPWMMIPALHVIDKTHSAENQVGIRFLQIQKNGEHTTTVRSLKGLIESERELVSMPKKLSSVQKKIFGALVESPLTVGQIEYVFGSRSGLTREQIRKHLKSMMVDDNLIVHDEASGVYDFSQEILQKQIVYPNPDLTKYSVEDRIVGFGCLHAGATAGENEFFVNEVPKFILARNATLLIAAGDLTEGLAHCLLERGEVVSGINNTQQELFAAHLIGEVIVRVFKGRIDTALTGFDTAAYSQDDLRTRVSSCLIPFLYVPGNHDDWQSRRGTTPLRVFHDALITYVKSHVGEILNKKGLFLGNLGALVVSKITRDSMTEKISYVSPISGLSVKTVHPGTARNETVSALSQRVLAKWNKAHVIFSANWHVAARVEEYDSCPVDVGEHAVHLGQRLVMQCPTILTHTAFEDGKIKRTDFGICYARIRSHKQHIIEVEGAFHGPSWKKRDDYDNAAILNEYVIAPLGVRPIVEHPGQE